MDLKVLLFYLLVPKKFVHSSPEIQFECLADSLALPTFISLVWFVENKLGLVCGCQVCISPPKQRVSVTPWMMCHSEAL